MKNKTKIIIVIVWAIIGGVLYFTNTCNRPFIKGNINSEGERIYHTKDGEYYNKTKINRSKGERCFFSKRQAVSAGWRASLK